MMRPLRQINRWLARHLTPAVRQIFLVNVCVFLGIQAGLQLFPETIQSVVTNVWGLTPRLATRGLRLWQFVSYMFVHVSGIHILLNMMVLWFFGPELEARWGSSRFWRFYLVTGVGAGLVTAAVWIVTRANPGPVIGASGALFGLLLAFWAYHPDRMAYLWGIVGIRIRYLVPMIFLLELLTLNRQDGISHITHVAGAAVGYYYLVRFHRTASIGRWRYR